MFHLSLQKFFTVFLVPLTKIYVKPNLRQISTLQTPTKTS